MINILVSLIFFFYLNSIRQIQKKKKKKLLWLITITIWYRDVIILLFVFIASACSVPTSPGSLIARIAYLGGSITCGDSLRVTCVGTSPPCTDKSVVVKVVDHCSTCRGVTMVLSHEAISVIANPISVKEVININYQK